MQLLFIPEFASQQLCRVVGDLPQPLLQGLALFGVEVGRYRALRRLDDIVVSTRLVAGRGLAVVAAFTGLFGMYQNLTLGVFG